MTRRISPVALLLLAGLMAQPAYAKVHLTHYHWVAWGAPVLSLIQAKAAEFQKQNPNVQVDIVQHADWDKILVATAGGKSPDVFDCYIGGVAKFVKAGLLADLSPYLKRDRISPDQFVKPVYDGFRFEGTTFGFPIGYGTVGICYVKQPIAEAGLAMPNTLQASGTWDWAALEEYGKKLTKDVNKDGKVDVYGIGTSLQTGRFPMYAQQAGEPLFDKYLSPSKSNFQSSAARQGFKYLLGLLTNKVMLNDWNSLANKKAVIAVDAFAGIHTSIGKTMGEKNIDIVEQPRGPKNAGSMFSANAYHISKGSKNKDLSWKWLKFLLMGEANQKAWMSASGKMSAFKAYEDLYAKRPGFPEHVAAYITMANNPDTVPIYDSPLKDFNTLGDECIARLADKKLGLEQWQADSDKRFTALLARMKR